MTEPESHLERILRSGRFAVTGEVGGLRSAEGESSAASARAQLGYVDALNVGDNGLATAHMSPVAEAAFVAAAGVEPIMQLTCRDRNRLALVSDLLGGWAVRARNLLCLSGDPMSVGETPDATEVRDLDVPDLVRLAAGLREEGRLPWGAEIDSPPRYFIGVADSPLAEPYDVARLELKLDAGAHFVQTQIVYDVDAIEAWADVVRTHGVFERAFVLVGVAPLRSLKMARWLNESLPGVMVPGPVIAALEEAGPDAEEGVGTRLTIEVVNRLKAIPGIVGVHVMGLGHEEAVRRVIEGAGLFPRPNGAP
ncbi:MAG: methylenetetrahydrofolate reductase [Actinobacteria bacterium]|nr:methylenetetrahydrofolate reductase [Actinomycetota bacterium]